MKTIIKLSNELIDGEITFDEFCAGIRDQLDALTDDELSQLARLIVGWGRPL